MNIDNKERKPAPQIYPKVTIIILHLKDITCLVDCVNSLNKITYQNYDIIIAHNGPESRVLIDTLAPLSIHITKVIDTGSNIGFSRANNMGIAQALQNGAEYILLLNDDTEVYPDFLTTLINVAKSRPDAGMLGPKIFAYDQPQKIWFAGARFDPETCMVTTNGFDQTPGHEDSVPVESDYVTGCALLVKKNTIEKIGILEEKFFLYNEDVDWGLRCNKAGLKNLIVHNSQIQHKISVSGGGMDSLIRAYHKTRSNLLMAKLHAPNALWKLHIHFFRDIAWLLFKSHDPNRRKKAKAFFSAMIDHHLGKTGKGPHWIWAEI